MEIVADCSRVEPKIDIPEPGFRSRRASKTDVGHLDLAMASYPDLQRRTADVGDLVLF